MHWDADAADTLRKIPTLVRPLVRRKVEAFARDRGAERVTPELLEEARRQLGPRSDQTEAMQPDPAQIEELERKLLSQEAEKRTTRTYTVRVCAGAVGCPRSLIPVAEIADALAVEIEASGFPGHLTAGRQGRPILSHHRFHAAVAGCPNACSQPQICDFGVVGRAQLTIDRDQCNSCGDCLPACREDAISLGEAGAAIDDARCIGCADCLRACAAEAIHISRSLLQVLAGGKLGRHPKLAQEVLPAADLSQVEDALARALTLLMREGEPGERLGTLLARVPELDSELR